MTGLFEYGKHDWASRPQEAFEAFLALYQFNGRKLRPSSFAIYSGMFARLNDWMRAQNVSILDLNEVRLHRFLDERKLSAESRHRYLLVFKELFRHLSLIELSESADETVTVNNPAVSLLLEAPAPEREEPEWLTPQELQALLQNVPRGDNWKKQRNRALIYFLLGAGLKAAELLALKLADLNFKDNQLQSIWVRPHLPRPGRKVPVQYQYRSHMEDWVKIHAQEKLPADFLFPSKPIGGELTQVSLFRIIKTALEDAGIEKRYMGATLLRNTCGKIWLDRYSPVEVMQWMGHEQLKTTELLLPEQHRSAST